MKKIILAMFLIIFILSVTQSQSKEFIKGADISWLQEIESGGGIYREKGIPNDALLLLKEHGFNYIRLRIWHTPAKGINGLDSTLIMASRIKNAGMNLLLDFHFSDWWADPGHQTKPAAWDGVPFTILKDSVRTYVHNVFAALKKQGTLPQMVQFGNEIICGMLWPDGYVCSDTNQSVQWNHFADLLISAGAGMKEVIKPTDTVLTMIHIDKGGDYSASQWFFDNLVVYNVDFDIIGLSYYPWWQGSLENMNSTIQQLENRYHKDIILAETAYPFTLQNYDSTNNIVGSSNQLHLGYPATVDGQLAFLSTVIQNVKNIPNNHGRGVFYWEPAAITAPLWGSPWENLALFDNTGEVLRSIKAFENIPDKVDFQNDTKNLPFALSAFPNPFNPTTTIQFSIPQNPALRDLPVTLKVYDVLGKEIATLINERKNAGTYSVRFNAQHLPSGIYFYTLTTGSFTSTKKLVMIK